MRLFFNMEEYSISDIITTFYRHLLPQYCHFHTLSYIFEFFPPVISDLSVNITVRFVTFCIFYYILFFCLLVFFSIWMLFNCILRNYFVILLN